MIHFFTAENYYSFDEEVTIDFRVGGNAPDNGSYFYAPSDTRLSNVQAIMGPNASGKTTALRALVFLSWLLTKSFRNDADELPLMGFAGNKKSKPTTLKVVFELSNGLYGYSVCLDQTRILNEELYVRNISSVRTRTKKLFSRAWNQDTEAYEIDDKALGLTEKYWSGDQLHNTSLITAASRFGHEWGGMITAFWKKLETNLSVHNGYMPDEYQAYMALQYYGKNKPSKEKAEKEAKRYADLGINVFGEDGTIKHKYGDVEFELELDRQSSGTQRFLSSSKHIDEALGTGGIAVIDELDAFLHPGMYKALIEKFKFENKKNAQLLISAHETLTLQILDKYQISIAEKNKVGSTEVARLDKNKDLHIRADDNLFTKYINGELGGWPTIDESLT